MERLILGCLVVAACSPPAYHVEYQRQHESEWIPPSAVSSVVRPPMTESQLRRGLGSPASRRTSIVGDTEIHHYEFCTNLRVFYANEGEVQFMWWDGGWHPVRWQTCGAENAGERFRVVTANGIVSQVYF